MSRALSGLFVAVLVGLGYLAAVRAAEVDDTAYALLDRATLRVDSGRHSAAVTSIAAFSDGSRIVTGSEDRTIRIWNAQSGELLRTLRPPSSLEGDEGRIYAVALSSDGRTLAAGGYTRFFDERRQLGSAVYLFDTTSGALVRKLSGISANVRNYRIERIVFSPDGKRLAVRRSSDRTLALYDLAAGADLDKDFNQQGQRYLDIDLDSAGNLLLPRSMRLEIFDGTLRPSASANELPPLFRARFVAGGKQIAMVYEDGRVEVRQPLAKKSAPALLLGAKLPKLSRPTAVAISQDGQTLFLGAQRDDTAHAVLRRLPLKNPSEGRDLELPVATVNDLVALPGGAVAFAAADGSWGIVESSDALRRYGVSRVWDAPPHALRVDKTGDEIELYLGPRAADRLRFNVPALELRATSAEDARLRPPIVEPPAPHRIIGWQHSPPVYLDDAVIASRVEDPAALAIAPGREAFLLGTARALLSHRFERATPDACPQPPGPKDSVPAPCFARLVPSAVRAVNYSGDGRFAVALLADGTVRWYGAQDGRERLALLAQPGDARWLLFRPDGLYAASPSGAELAGWQVNDLEERAPDFFPLSRFKQRLERPEEVAATLSGPVPSAPPSTVASTNLRRDELPPLVTILEPADGALISDTTVAVKLALRLPANQPATALRVRIDGRPVSVAQPRGIIDMATKEAAQSAPSSSAPQGASSMLLNITVPQRDCVVAIYAESSAGAGPPALLRLRWRGPGEPNSAGPRSGASKPPTLPQPQGALRVLTIGVDDYQQAALQLHYPGKDARDLAALLSQLHNAKSGPRLYQSVDVRVLTGRQATRANILEALDWLQHRATAADTTILFLAGHGINEPTTGEYFFLPVDADSTSALRTMLPASTLQQVLRSVQGRIVLLLDTCHSGNVLGQSGRKTRGLPPLSRAIAELSSVDSGIVVMAAATGAQASLEDTAWQNGAFAKAILEGLGGRADLRHSGRVTVNMLDLYVSERVRELTDGSQTPATAKPSTIADFPLVLSRPE